MKHIVSWSGGKDSTATIILAHENGLPIDLIVISLMWFDKKKKIYAEYPEHTKWIFEYAIPIFESWGYPVKVITSEKDYKYWFYHVVTKSTKHPERNGKYSGFVLGDMCKMNGEKTTPIKKYLDSLEYEYEEYVGIAIDEPDRLRRLNGKAGKSSLLERYGYTEIMAREKCEEYGLLSPSYKIFKRGGLLVLSESKYSGLCVPETDIPGILGRIARAFARRKYGIAILQIRPHVRRSGKRRRRIYNIASICGHAVIII